MTEIQNKNGDWESAEIYNKNNRLIPLYDDRNYDLFAVLADVRNYNDIPFIDSPREIPDDCSVETYKEYRSWGADSHSASYLTLREIQEFAEENTSIKDIVQPIIIRMIQRVEMYSYETGVYNFSKDMPDRVRIVFWFDN